MNELQEIKESYYKYIGKLGEGCLTLADLIRQGKDEEAFISIENFAEGMQWLVAAENLLRQEGYTINSRIPEANEYLVELNEALSIQDMVTVADLFEYEIHPLFSSASEWIFTEEVRED